MSGRSGGFLAGYHDVDDRDDAAARIAYLDRIPSAAEYKRQTYAMLAPSPGERILDVGCGTGGDALELARRVGPRGRVIGLDRSRALLAEARRRAGSAPPLQLVQGDAQALQFADHVFDACRADRTLQHLDHPERALAEMARVVRPGGRVVASEPDWDTLVIDAPDRELTRRLVHYRCDRLRQGRCGRRLARLFAAAGLEAIVIRPMSVVLRDFETAETLCRLSEGLDSLVTTGEVERERAEAWLAHQRRAGREGTFFAAMTGFCVRGEKAEQKSGTHEKAGP